MRLTVIFLIIIFVIGLITPRYSAKATENSKKNKKKNWDKVLNSLEKDWEKGDENEELIKEFELNQKISQKKSKKINLNDPKEMKKLADDPLEFAGSSGASNKMAFIDLKTKNADGKSVTKEDVDLLASRWVSMLRSGSLAAGIYNIGEMEKGKYEPKLLISIDKTWMLKDIFKFVLTQPETVKISLDSKDYLPGDKSLFGDDDL